MKNLVAAGLILAFCSAIVFGTEFVSHDAIYIDGNDSFTTHNGVVGGSGDADDPYVLEGWAIAGSTGHGLTIVNADAYCIIRNCQVTRSQWSGILIADSSNVIIEECEIVQNAHSGVEIVSSSRIAVRDSSIDGHTWGIGLRDVSDTDLHGNLVAGSSEAGISGEAVNRCLIVGNEVTRNDLGIGLYNSRENFLAGNEIHGNSSGGIDLWPGSSRNELVNNVIVENSTHGIWVQEGSDETVITLNTVSMHTGAGLRLTGACSNHVAGNSFSTNLECDVDLDSSQDNSFVWNSFLSSTPVSVSYSPVPEGLQANAWDNGSEGNYWYVLDRWDSNGDGLSDVPFNAGEGEMDRFPLMRPWQPTVAIRGVHFSVPDESATLVNWTDATITLDGWSLLSVDPATDVVLGQYFFPDGISLPAGQLLVVRSIQDGAEISSQDAVADWASESGNVWRDWGGAARLISPGGNLVDEYTFDWATGV